MTEAAYERVARGVRASLGKPGSLIPSEAELVAQYDVSRNTVRRALAALETEGLITSGQGHRRKVRSIERWCWPMHRWEDRQHHTDTGDAWATSIRSQGGEPSTTTSVFVTSADDEIAESLDIQTGESVTVRSRIRSVNGDPHQLQESFFPQWLVDEHPEFLKPGDIHAPGGLLAAAGLPQTRFYDALSARMPTHEEANLLRITPATPLIVHARTGYDIQGRPVRHMVTRAAADRVEISYSLEAMSGYMVPLTWDDRDTVRNIRTHAETWLAERGLEQYNGKNAQKAREDVEQELKNGRIVGWRENGRIVAVAAIKDADLDFWTPEEAADPEAVWVARFMVAENGHGYGAALLNAIIDQQRQAGKTKIRLDCWRTNNSLHDYYRSQGFQHLRTVDVRGRWSGALFERRI